MGCAQSQQPLAPGASKPVVNFRMELTHIPEYDTFFSGLSVPLTTLNDTSTSFSQAKRQYTINVGLYKRLRDKTIPDLILAMLYCYSASSNGDLSSLKFKATTSPPFYDVNKESLRPEFRNIPISFELFVKTLMQVPDRLEPLRDQIDTAATRCAGSG